MIELRRSKEHKWILQKNVSSNDLIKEYLAILKKQKEIDLESVMKTMGVNGNYTPRGYYNYVYSLGGSKNTMGVRLSQMCFYMFGYVMHEDNKKIFMPSPMTENMFIRNEEITSEENILTCLYSMQYPHPYSETSTDFNIYIGRFIIHLLLDERLSKRLYIDELIWFLPFIETISPEKYQGLIESILEYRSLSYKQKLDLFQSVENYDDVFSNAAHEMNYYFVRIFQAFGVFECIKDVSHNQGQLFEFRHGTNSKRNDAYKSRAHASGYITLSDKVIDAAKKLDSTFCYYETPTSMRSDGILTEKDWLVALYEVEPISYMSCISRHYNKKEKVNIISKMVTASKYGSRDGKDFEVALKDFMTLFRENLEVELLSGAGKTDLLCVMVKNNSEEEKYKINVEAKTRINTLSEINANRICNHLIKHVSDYCIIVAPRFSNGVTGDIKNHPIVIVKAEDLGSYCYRQCITSYDGLADYTNIDKIIRENLGKDITKLLQKNNESMFGIEN